MTTDLAFLIYLALIGSLIGMPLVVAFRQVRLERRRIMDDGTVAVHYLPKWARCGFIPALTYVERSLDIRSKLLANEMGQKARADGFSAVSHCGRRATRCAGGTHAAMQALVARIRVRVEVDGRLAPRDGLVPVVREHQHRA